MENDFLEIDYNDVGELSSLDLTEQEVKRILVHVLADQDVSRPCEVSLSIVTNEEMQKVNAQWREVDTSTDVISIECERPDDTDVGEGEIVCLGDIFLSPAYISEQAKHFQASLKDETTLLLVHAMLHLLGYNHIDDNEAQEMEALEDRLVAELKTSD